MPDPVTAPSTALPQAASLDNPLYYLANVDTVVGWILARHRDLLLEAEGERLHAFLALPTAHRALLVRMITRSRDLFRPHQLDYSEIDGDRDTLLAALVADGWIDDEPALTAADLAALLRRDELYGFFARQLRDAGLPPSTTKARLVAALADFYLDSARPLSRWRAEEMAGDDQMPPLQILALEVAPLFERVRLMFFGNLRQSWSEFVVTELGHQRYEAVEFSPASRAFHCRADVDTYLALHHLAARLEDGEAPRHLWADQWRTPLDNRWLDHRRRRWLQRLGRQAERDGDSELALAAYRNAWQQEARIRYFRVREKQPRADALLPELASAWQHSTSNSERLLLARIVRRLDKHHPLARRRRLAGDCPTEHLTLPAADGVAVERRVADHLTSADSHCYYVENGLFNSLLGLLLWPALYAPLPGAFFHPFQSGPADLYREDFVSRRQSLVDRCLAGLDDGSYQQRIRQCWQEKQGISCPLVHWSLLTPELLDTTLALVPAAHLKAIFTRLLQDLRRHRSGFPDLIRFWPDSGRYQLIEVKGPGDRLQDHQRLWLQYFADCGIAAGVCQVRWSQTP